MARKVNSENMLNQFQPADPNCNKSHALGRSNDIKTNYFCYLVHTNFFCYLVALVCTSPCVCVLEDSEWTRWLGVTDQF
jgi:hypothetical protein